MAASEVLRRSTAAVRTGLHRLPQPGTVQETALTAIKAGLAAGVSYAIAGAVTGEAVPVFAPLTALLAVSLSVRSSLRQTVPRVVALVLGVVLAVVTGVVVGLTVVSVAVLSLASVLAARVLRLPGPAASQVPVTALLLVALGGGRLDAAELRVVDGLIGLLVGILVNAFVAPPLRLRPAVEAADRVAEALADLFADLATGLPQPARPARAREWLQRARQISAQVDELTRAVAEAEEAHRWNPRGRGTTRRVERLTAASVAFTHVANQMRGVTRTVADATVDGLLRAPEPGARPPSLPWGYARVCAAAGDAVRAFGDLVTGDCTLESEPGRRLVQAVALAGEARSALVEDVLAQGLRREELLLHGSLLADLRRIARELDPERGGHRDAVRPALRDEDADDDSPPAVSPTAERPVGSATGRPDVP